MKKYRDFILYFLFTLFCFLIYWSYKDYVFNRNQEIIIATSSGYPPMVYINEKGELVGKEVEIVQKLCKKLPFRYKIVDVEFDNLISGLTTYKYDIIFGGITHTPEREKQFLFTNNIYVDYVVLVSKKIERLTQINNRTILGCQSGTAHEDDVSRLDDLYDVKDIKVYEDLDSLIRGLEIGQVDAIILDYSVASEKFNKYHMIQITKENVVALGVRKDRADLVNLLNTSINRLYRR